MSDDLTAGFDLGMLSASGAGSIGDEFETGYGVGDRRVRARRSMERTNGGTLKEFKAALDACVERRGLRQRCHFGKA